MRSSLVAVAAVLLVATAACDSPAGDSPVPPPTKPMPSAATPATPRTSPSRKPVRHGTVRNNDTRFRVSVASVRTAGSFAHGGKHERAKAGERLVVVMLTAKNVGKRTSRVDWDNSEPVDLAGEDGRTYYPRMSFGRPDDGVFPGRSLTEPYVFPVPVGTRPAYVIVTLFDASGFASTADLTLP